MPINDRVMTQPRTCSSAAFRVAASGTQAAAYDWNRQLSCRGVARDHLSAGHGNGAYPDSDNEP